MKKRNYSYFLCTSVLIHTSDTLVGLVQFYGMDTKSKENTIKTDKIKSVTFLVTR